MTALLPPVFGALIAAGLLGMPVALHRVPRRPPASRRPLPFAARLSGLTPLTRRLLVAGAVAGLLVAVVTGWVIALIVVPAAVVGLPALLSAPSTAERIERAEALEEWTRSLGGILGGGIGLEQALIATVRSTPEPIRAQVSLLAARLRARWSTEDAIRAFADDLDDATGDVVAANLLLAATRRNRGLASVLQGLAESVAADVAARRRIEADRAKPRGTARLVTLITAGVLVVLALTGSYIEPYGTPIGQVILAVLLAAYVAGLVWMRRMAAGTPLPRFIGATARAGTR